MGQFSLGSLEIGLGSLVIGVNMGLNSLEIGWVSLEVGIGGFGFVRERFGSLRRGLRSLGIG